MTPLPSARYAVWHDRAVFHFLTDPRDRARDVAQAERAERPGGHVTPPGSVQAFVYCLCRVEPR